MIYALVEPSIYMIASILPTTRHLVRRVRRRAAHAKSGGDGPSRDGSGRHLQSGEELEPIENSDISSGGGITRQVDIWQGHANSSQEGLTLGEWYPSRQTWDQKQAVDKVSPATPEERSSASGGTTGL